MTDGIVYILTNEAMPGYVKIGKTAENLNVRLKQLDTTSVPIPFTCFFAARVSDYDLVERRLHEAFGDHRVSSRREFFRISPERVVAALSIANGQDITPRDDVVEFPEDQKAINDARVRRGRFSFDLVGIKSGEILTSAFDPSITCIVADKNKVIFEGQETSLSAAAMLVAQRKGYKWTAIAGPDYWLCNDRSLTELRQDIEDLC